MVGKVAQLEFRLVDDDPSRLKAALEGNVPQGFILKYVKEKEREPVLLEDQVALSGERVSDAKVDFDTQGFGQPYISLALDNEGAAEFANVTRTNVGRRLAILLDGEVLSAPNIKEAILGGSAQISGQFTLDEASLLALALRSGCLAGSDARGRGAYHRASAGQGFHRGRHQCHQDRRLLGISVHGPLLHQGGIYRGHRLADQPAFDLRHHGVPEYHAAGEPVDVNPAGHRRYHSDAGHGS